MSFDPCGGHVVHTHYFSSNPRRTQYLLLKTSLSTHGLAMLAQLTHSCIISSRISSYRALETNLYMFKKLKTGRKTEISTRIPSKNALKTCLKLEHFLNSKAWNLFHRFALQNPFESERMFPLCVIHMYILVQQRMQAE